MASIENRSSFIVTVKNRDDLARTFARNTSGQDALRAYIKELQGQGFKPKLASLNDSYAVRVRQVGYATQTIFAKSEQEALDIKQRIESERRRGIFIDYSRGWQTTFAELLVRYLREEAPRHKSFEVEAYKINAMLEDAGLERVSDLAGVIASHANPHPVLTRMKMRKPSGKRSGMPSGSTHFIRRPFASLTPEDFTDYIDERCQFVSEATVDRELDLFTAVCNIAIETWRIPVSLSPMAGVRRPKYFNERDRRLREGELERLLEAAREEDHRRSIEVSLESLLQDDRLAADEAKTAYRRKNIIKTARERYRENAEANCIHIALVETFVHFQLMTGARRSETLSLTWANVDLDGQTALLPDTKNGRARRLPLRSDLVEMLRALPKEADVVFPITADYLRKAWMRICERAGFVADNELRIHDLRHEAISRVAEAGSSTPGGFSLVDLQAFSGHRDMRMLLRYANLSAGGLAKRLDTAFSSERESCVHHGRRRLKGDSSVGMSDVIAGCSAQDRPPAVAPALSMTVNIPAAFVNPFGFAPRP